MKTKLLLLSLLLYSVSAISFSQNSGNSLIANERYDSVGLKPNTISDSNRVKSDNIFKPGYVYWNPLPKKLGIEISGSFYNLAYPWMESYGVSLALYAGNQGSSDGKKHSFGELYRLYSFYLDKTTEHFGRESNIYMAPGVSLFSKNRKFSLSVYQKTSVQVFDIGNQKSVPLKANFHF